jgi:hypothetical protein
MLLFTSGIFGYLVAMVVMGRQFNDGRSIIGLKES